MEINPNFIIVGAMKCGTTSLFHWLRPDERLRLSRPKELNFFNTQGGLRSTARRGLGWYNARFRPGTGPSGEASTNYTKSMLDPYVAKRIFSHNPEVRIIYLVRNPIDRALSHWAYMGDFRGFKACLHTTEHDSPCHVISVSSYFEQMSRYWELFTKKQILIIPLEDMAKDPDQVMMSFYNHIGLEAPGFQYKDLPRSNKTPEKRKIHASREERKILRDLLAEDVRKFRLQIGRNDLWLADFPND